jgi:hypothetical protein
MTQTTHTPILEKIEMIYTYETPQFKGKFININATRVQYTDTPMNSYPANSLIFSVKTDYEIFDSVKHTYNYKNESLKTQLEFNFYYDDIPSEKFIVDNILYTGWKYNTMYFSLVGKERKISEYFKNFIDPMGMSSGF